MTDFITFLANAVEAVAALTASQLTDYCRWIYLIEGASLIRGWSTTT